MTETPWFNTFAENFNCVGKKDKETPLLFQLVAKKRSAEYDYNFVHILKLIEQVVIVASANRFHHESCSKNLFSARH